MKKAQLTMFIILGIVIISIFGFLFFATGQVQRLQSEQQAQLIIGQILETTSLKYYVNLCAQKALEEGIDRISKQGGKIFPGQDGSLMTNNEQSYSYTDSNGKEYQVAYGILKGNVPPPQYPCRSGFDNFNVPPAYCAYSSAQSIFNRIDFGIDNLPSLCKDRFGGCSIYEGWNSVFSVQSQLESIVSKAVKECVNFASITGMNQTYNVTEGDPTTNITFSDRSVIAVVNFPIIIMPLAGQPIVTFVTFQSSLATRFKQAYSLARDLVVHDVSSYYTPAAPFFNILAGFEGIWRLKYSEDPGFTVEKRENASGYDDFVKIIDRRAEPGKDLVVQFVIENRPPVLNYYGTYERPIVRTCGTYDFKQMQNSRFSIVPSAFDTEEDAFTFSYSGWLENYNETTDLYNVQFDADGCVVNALTTKNAPIPSRWDKDSDFLHNGKASTYVSEYDVGFHNLTISVCDSQYCDNQTIRILIDDILKISVNKTNRYGNNILSVEDPYKLTASVRDIYDPGNYLFAWIIDNVNGVNNPLYRNDSGDKELNLPLGDYDILNIKDKYLQNSPVFAVGNTYKITASVIQQGNNPVTNETQEPLRVCVPFHNGNPPFPYNVTDPFMSDHACCASETVLNGTTDVCYKNTTYGSFISFTQGSYNTSYDKSSNKIGNPQYSLSYTGFASDISASINKIQAINNYAFSAALTDIKKNANDIIERSFKRFCDNTRGNICVGNMVETYSVVEECRDKNTAIGETATCSGPPIDYLQENSEANTRAGCLNYTGTSLEKELGITSSNVCNPTPKCISDNATSNGYANAGNNPRYICNATCGGDFGCSKPTQCHDCWQDQECTGPAQPDAANAISFTVKKSSGCLNAYCGFVTSQPKNTCIDDENISAAYCREKSQFNSNEPNTTSRISCRILSETLAEDTDNGDYPLSFGICVQKMGGCDSNQMKCTVTSVQFTDKKVTDNYGNSNYTEYYPADIFGSQNVKETCKRKDYDYDSNQNLCELPLYELNGKWDSSVTGPRRCCGDDAGEIWNTATGHCSYS